MIQRIIGFLAGVLSQTKIQTALEALETLGLVTQHTETNQTKWYFAEHQTIA